MSKWIVDIHGDIEGDYDFIREYEEPKTGHWIYVREDKYRCSKCSTTTRVDESGIDEKPMYKFCPYCGAKMESEEISERNMKMWEDIFKAERSDKE